MAGRIDERQIAEIVEQTDMHKLVEEVVPLTKAGVNFKGRCPFHNEKTPSFHIHPGKKVYHCYGCGAGGNLITFVRETRGVSFGEAVEFLAERLGIQVRRENVSSAQLAEEARAQSARGRLLDLMRCAQQWFVDRFEGRVGEPVRRYALEERQLSAEVAERFGLGAAGEDWEELLKHLKGHGFGQDEVVHAGLAVARETSGAYDKFRRRLMYPIVNASGEVVAFGGRRYRPDDESAKYMNPTDVLTPGTAPDSRFHVFYKKGRVVFGLWQARQAIKQRGHALLVEGNLDVMTLHQYGFDHAVAAMGTAVTDHQAKLLKKHTDRVTLMFDGEPTGRQKSLLVVATLLAAGLSGHIAFLPFDQATGEKSDPDSFLRTQGSAALQALLDRAPPMVEGYIDALLADQGRSVNARRKVLEQAGPLLGALGNPTERDLARAYLLSRLADSEAERAVLARGLASMPAGLPSATYVEPTETPAARPDPTVHEPEIGALEAQLGALLVSYPSLLAEAEQAGLIHRLDHAGLRLALRDLCAWSRDRELTVDTVQLWLGELPDGRARRLLLKALLGEPVSAERARTSLAQVRNRLQQRLLTQEERRLLGDLKVRGLSYDQQATLMVQLQATRAQLQELQQAFEVL